MQLLRKILSPLSLLYGGITGVRNELYNRKILKSHSYDIPVICVGNLSVGGTGKSPMVEYLISILEENYLVATLSRGYKRTTTGFYLLQGSENAREVGDEPLQFKINHPDILVAVDEVRSRGIENLLNLDKKPEVILLDDAFQHRQVSAGLNILLTPYQKLYTRDFMLPAGDLREPRHGARRAQIIIVTKCPENISREEKMEIAKQLKVQTDQKLFFSKIEYDGHIRGAETAFPLSYLQARKFTLVTGIANPRPLVHFLEELKLTFEHLQFPDHHKFSARELEMINKEPMILTTEKDFMRLKGEVESSKLYYLPIKTGFLGGEAEFRDLIETFVQKK